ncbi:hypothetical protein FIBSPDRAFT_873560 [Athelia psychrophila]|uniref:Uncharacterized protein n=1 Tax=Athelia psychrophila TaxID=1759441 RepID=A0A165YBW5_9AGAM|nr:hypothetical protein FIBSPDRAFT_873560 [Fibularhizoctonia sp. CBS 109695]
MCHRARSHREHPPQTSTVSFAFESPRDQPFTEITVKSSYDGYLAALKEWSAIEPAVTESIRHKQFKKALRGAGASVQKVTGMSKEAKLRARTNLVGREVDTASESEYDRGAQSEEL